MSRGRGKIESAIADVFALSPKLTWTTPMMTTSAPPNGDLVILHVALMVIAAARTPELRARFVELAGGTESAAHEYLRRPRALKTMQGADYGPLASALWPNQRWDSTHEVQASYAKARELLQIEDDLVAVAVAELNAERWRLHGSDGEPLHLRPIPSTVWANPGAVFHFDTNTVEIGSSQLRSCRMQRIEILSLDDAIRELYGRNIRLSRSGLSQDNYCQQVVDLVGVKRDSPGFSDHTILREARAFQKRQQDRG